MRKPLLIRVMIGCLLALALAWWVWPTPWSYSAEEYMSKGDMKMHLQRIRTSRFSGQVQTEVQPGEWIDGRVVF